MDAKRSGVLFRKNNVPQNTLHKQDLVHCAPCTRAILDEDIRAGRWWWESSHKVDYIKNKLQVQS
jgi:3'-phosphoadenosine 5'-phosphosulfate sulfotransferase (PAPS reductase)/FAD synthetase